MPDPPIHPAQQSPPPSQSLRRRRAGSPNPNAIVPRLRERKTFLGTREVTALLGVDRKWLGERVRKGYIRAYRVGQKYVFDPVELADWIEARSLS
jgi:excisionase family DNA binding protein